MVEESNSDVVTLSELREMVQIYEAAMIAELQECRILKVAERRLKNFTPDQSAYLECLAEVDMLQARFDHAYAERVAWEAEIMLTKAWLERGGC